MIDYSITKNGKALDESKYTIDLDTQTFFSVEDRLVLDFNGCGGWTFRTGFGCTFTTGWGCTFKTGCECTFNTGGNSTFNTGFGCTFNTDGNCTFNTDWNCTFNTRGDCTFHTGVNCTFNTGKCCTFMVKNIHSQKFESYDGISTILDREYYKRYVLDKELIQLLKVTNG